MANRGQMLALVAYSGHMWELYSVWTYFLLLYRDSWKRENGVNELLVEEKATSSLLTFGVVGSAAFSCMLAGYYADKLGRCMTCIMSLSVSGGCSLLFGPLAWGGTRQAVLVPLGLLWGASVIAESAQFSAISTELAEPSQVGTALTLQMAVGFAFTILSIFVVPLVESHYSWAAATPILAIGPAIGIVVCHWVCVRCYFLLSMSDIADASRQCCCCEAPTKQGR
ncbi:unnamed protein product [Chrysoparadoxa australica]